MKRMTSLLLTLVIGYATIVALMYILQRVLLYHPVKGVEAPVVYGLTDFTDHTTTTQDGVAIHFWYRPASQNFPTIAYFHGNAHNVSGRAGIYGALAQKGFGVLAVSYRGYGNSQGRPYEEGLYHDARAAMAFLKDKAIMPEHILLYGESLGTGVATRIATEYPVAGVILQAPYTSVENRASELYPFLPVRFMIHDKFPSIRHVPDIKAPILIFHGERDTIIPSRHGRAILEAARSSKEAVFFHDVDHNNFDNLLISEHVLKFSRKYRLIK